MTLGVLEPYRHLGLGMYRIDIDKTRFVFIHTFYNLGTDLLQHILEQAKLAKDISRVYLHVQTTNDKAVEFYKKFGFEVIGTEKDYYKNIEPKDAYILSKTIEQ